MKYTTVITITAASLLAVAPLSADAGQAKGGGSAKQVQQADQARSQAQQHETQHERLRERDQVLHGHSHTLRDEDIYGSELMSSAERDRYREQLQLQTSETERKQFQLEHEQTMRQRAWQQGKDLVPPGQGSVYGGELMTVQERNAYREQLRQIEAEEDRARFEARHRERMDQRARALRLDIEEAE